MVNLKSIFRSGVVVFSLIFTYIGFKTVNMTKSSKTRVNVISKFEEVTHETRKSDLDAGEVTDQPHLAEVQTSFEQFGFKNLSMLKKRNAPRPYFNFTTRPWRILPEIPRSLETKVVNWSMIVAVKSNIERPRRREVIRRTWGSIRYLDGLRMEVVFVVARTKKRTAEIDVQKENALYGDLLQVDMAEVYQKVGLKAVASMQWVWQHFPGHWLFSSADDDVVPDLTKLQETFEKAKRGLPAHVKTVENSTIDIPILCTYQYTGLEKPQRAAKGKWKVDKVAYPYDRYPPFCLGGFYTMPIKLSTGIFFVSRYFPYFRLDDVWLTGFMRLKYCDIYESDDFLFNKTDINCAISTAPSFNAVHLVSATDEYFINKWIPIENNITSNAKEVIKI